MGYMVHNIYSFVCIPLVGIVGKCITSVKLLTYLHYHFEFGSTTATYYILPTIRKFIPINIKSNTRVREKRFTYRYGFRTNTYKTYMRIKLNYFRYIQIFGHTFTILSLVVIDLKGTKSI